MRIRVIHAICLVLPIILLAACAAQTVATSTPTVPVTVAPSLAPTLTFTPTPHSPTSISTVTVPASLTPTFIVTQPPTVPPTLETHLTATPGLLLRGYVRLADGTGLANVSICRNYASYNGVVVATTDANGYYQSEFAFIPGDEMVGVWPMAAGYVFDPPTVRWRHYYGVENSSHDFTASPASATAAPPTSCP